MDSNDALVLVFSRNAFYKRLHYLVLGAFALSLCVIVFLIIILSYLLRNPTHPIYFATDNVGRLIQIVPVSKPNMSTEDVTAWAVAAVEAVNSYDYINFRAQLQDAEKYFTTYGWTKYMAALRASNNLLGVTKRKQVIIAEVIGQPKILAQGILGGSFAWKYQMQILVTFSEPPYDNKSKFTNSLIATVIVQRQPVLQGYKGLGIVQLTEDFASTTNQPQEMSGASAG
jgi:intracellular multiplication protein IcmL